MENKQVSGQIERVVSFEGKFGPMFSILVKGDKYGTGKNSMGASEGDWVSFTAVDKSGKGFWDVEKGSLKPAEAPVNKTKPVPAQSNQTGGSYDLRQDSIVYQSSRKDALHFVEILASLSLIDFGKAKGADKLAILETYLDKYTEHFITEVKQNKPFASQGETEVSYHGSDAELAKAVDLWANS